MALRTTGTAENLETATAFPTNQPESGIRRPPVQRRQSMRPGPVRGPARRPLAAESRALRPRSPGAGARRVPTTVLDQRVVQQMLTTYTPLVRQIAGGFQRRLPRNVLREDLIAAGMSGLWDAIRRHADKPSESFEWYVRVRIRGAILDELRAQDWLPRRARAAAAEANEQGESARAFAPAVVRFDDVSEWEQNRCLATLASSEAAVDAKFTRETLARAVEQLPTRERHIVAAHYFRGVKFKDLGTELGVSEPRISQLHSRAMQRLRVIMAAAA